MFCQVFVLHSCQSCISTPWNKSQVSKNRSWTWANESPKDALVMQLESLSFKPGNLGMYDVMATVWLRMTKWVKAHVLPAMELQHGNITCSIIYNIYTYINIMSYSGRGSSVEEFCFQSCWPDFSENQRFMIKPEREVRISPIHDVPPKTDAGKQRWRPDPVHVQK